MLSWNYITEGLSESDDDDGSSYEQYNDNDNDDDNDDITLPSSLRHLPMPSSTSSSIDRFEGDRLEGGRVQGGRRPGDKFEGSKYTGGKMEKHEYGSVRSGSVMSQVSQVSDDGSYLSDGDTTTTTTNHKNKVITLVLYHYRCTSTPVNIMVVILVMKICYLLHKLSSFFPSFSSSCPRMISQNIRARIRLKYDDCDCNVVNSRKPRLSL